MSQTPCGRITPTPTHSSQLPGPHHHAAPSSCEWLALSKSLCTGLNFPPASQKSGQLYFYHIRSIHWLLSTLPVSVPAQTTAVACWDDHSGTPIPYSYSSTMHAPCSSEDEGWSVNQAMALLFLNLRGISHCILNKRQAPCPTPQDPTREPFWPLQLCFQPLSTLDSFSSHNGLR